MSDYHINVFWSEEDGSYVAANWLAAALEPGKPIPEPRYRPEIYEIRR